MIDALFIACVGVVVVIVMLLEFPAEGDIKSKRGERK